MQRDDDLLTITEAIAILQVPRSTFYVWRQKRRGPRSVKLPNGDIRIRRRDLADWIDRHVEVAS